MSLGGATHIDLNKVDYGTDVPLTFIAKNADGDNILDDISSHLSLMDTTDPKRHPIIVAPFKPHTDNHIYKADYKAATLGARKLGIAYSSVPGRQVVLEDLAAITVIDPITLFDPSKSMVYVISDKQHNSLKIDFTFKDRAERRMISLKSIAIHLHDPNTGLELSWKDKTIFLDKHQGIYYVYIPDNDTSRFKNTTIQVTVDGELAEAVQKFNGKVPYNSALRFSK